MGPATCQLCNSQDQMCEKSKNVCQNETQNELCLNPFIPFNGQNSPGAKNYCQHA